MGIESEDCLYSEAPHHLEAHAVYKTEIAPCSGKKCDDSRSMYLMGDEFNMELFSHPRTLIEFHFLPPIPERR
jgi:hypothetical protein